MNASEKLIAIKNILSKLDSAIIAFSGGVDSTLLLKLALENIPGRVLAVTAASTTYPIEEIEFARRIAQDLKTEFLLIETCELENPQFNANPPERCYYCKTELFLALKQIAEENDISVILDGSNFDDTGDFRPGSKAASEFKVISPLKMAQFTKADVRLLSKELGLPTWDKPAMACLSSRFPYGTQITKAKLQQVYQAEKFLRKRGILNVRVRHHDTIARIEVDLTAFTLFNDDAFREQLIKTFKQLGFNYITLDLAGFRSGSMNDVLSEEKKQWIQND